MIIFEHYDIFEHYCCFTKYYRYYFSHTQHNLQVKTLLLTNPNYHITNILHYKFFFKKHLVSVNLASEEASVRWSVMQNKPKTILKANCFTDLAALYRTERHYNTKT